MQKEKKVCTIVNEQLTWVLKVDDLSITVSEVDYFVKIFRMLGYRIVIVDNSIDTKTQEPRNMVLSDNYHENNLTVLQYIYKRRENIQRRSTPEYKANFRAACKKGQEHRHNWERQKDLDPKYTSLFRCTKCGTLRWYSNAKYHFQKDGITTTTKPNCI